MNEINEQAATLLAQKRHKIAELATDRYVEAHPDFVAVRGEVGRARCSADAAYHLAFLAEAVRFELPALFVDYLGWAKVLLHSLKLPESDLEENLRLLAETIEQVIPREIFGVISPVLSKAFECLASLPTTQKSFIEPAEPHHELASRWLKHLLNHQSRDARRIIMTAAEQGIPLVEIYRHVFTPALREIGRLWQTREISEAEEHYATEFSQSVLATLSARINCPRKKRAVLGFCVEGEHHDVGIRLALDCFALHGWDTVCFGSDVPTRNIRNTVAKWRPDAVAISATMVFNLPQVRSAIQQIRSVENQPRPKIVLGGRPFAICPELGPKLGADTCATDCGEIVLSAE